MHYVIFVFFRKNLLIFISCVFASLSVYVPCALVPTEARKGYWVFWSGIIDGYSEPPLQVLSAEPGASAGTASALSH